MAKAEGGSEAILPTRPPPGCIKAHKRKRRAPYNRHGMIQGRFCLVTDRVATTSQISIPISMSAQPAPKTICACPRLLWEGRYNFSGGYKLKTPSVLITTHPIVAKYEPKLHPIPEDLSKTGRFSKNAYN